MRIEIIHDRDPDEGCDVTVFLDGIRVTDVEVYGIDPGAGWLRSDWDESTDDQCAKASPAVAEQLRTQRDYIAESSTYIERDRDA